MVAFVSDDLSMCAMFGLKPYSQAESVSRLFSDTTKNESRIYSNVQSKAICELRKFSKINENGVKILAYIHYEPNRIILFQTMGGCSELLLLISLYRS